MKLLILIAAVAGSIAQAKTLDCRSYQREHIYYTDGHLELKATIGSGVDLSAIAFTVLPEDKLKSRDDESTGQVRGGYVRFGLMGDAWCSYRVALPEDFNHRVQPFTAFVDAYCEENTNSSHPLRCEVR